VVDDRKKRRGPSAIMLLLIAFLMLSTLWAFVVPLRDFQGVRSLFQPDEPNHIAVITYIANHGALPPYTFAYYESAHPPLYHLAAGVVYHFAQPLLGSDVSIYLLRLMGGVLGAALVWLVWRTALPLIGGTGALFAAALVGTVPMFVSISASVTNETLAALAGAGALAGLTAGIQRGYFDRRTLLTVAFWTAIGVGSKVTCLGLIPVALGVVGVVGWRHRLSLRGIAAQIGAILLITAALSGWWYARNAVLYGDPFRRKEATALWRERIPGYDTLSAQGKTTLPRYITRVSFWGWASFWGVFNAFRYPLPMGVYICLVGFQIACSWGLIRSVQKSGLKQSVLWPLAICAVPFAATVAIVYYRYTWDHYTPQGRFFFPLLLPFAIFSAAGWLWLCKGNRKEPLASLKTFGPVIASLVILNGYVLAQTLMERITHNSVP
jgi:hypothetical protein